MYKIISIKNTHPSDQYFTFWRPDNKGYCWSVDQAGEYEEPKDGYHNDAGNVPIILEDLIGLTVKHEEFGRVLMNDARTRKALGFTKDKNNIHRSYKP